MIVSSTSDLAAFIRDNTILWILECQSFQIDRKKFFPEYMWNLVFRFHHTNISRFLDRFVSVLSIMLVKLLFKSSRQSILVSASDAAGFFFSRMQLGNIGEEDSGNKLEQSDQYYKTVSF